MKLINTICGPAGMTEQAIQGYVDSLSNPGWVLALQSWTLSWWIGAVMAQSTGETPQLGRSRWLNAVGDRKIKDISRTQRMLLQTGNLPPEWLAILCPDKAATEFVVEPVTAVEAATVTREEPPTPPGPEIYPNPSGCTVYPPGVTLSALVAGHPEEPPISDHITDCPTFEAQVPASEYPADTVRECASSGWCTVPEIVAMLDRKVQDTLEPRQDRADSGEWAIWCSLVIALQTGMAVCDAAAAYDSGRLGREGSQIRRMLAHGKLPKAWRERLSLPPASSTEPAKSPRPQEPGRDTLPTPDQAPIHTETVPAASVEVLQASDTSGYTPDREPAGVEPAAPRTAAVVESQGGSASPTVSPLLAPVMSRMQAIDFLFCHKNCGACRYQCAYRGRARSKKTIKDLEEIRGILDKPIQSPEEKRIAELLMEIQFELQRRVMEGT